jgi:hypothetical protein
LYKASSSGSLRVPQNNDDRVSAEEHLADEPVLVHWKSLLLALASLWNLDKAQRMLVSIGNTIIEGKKLHQSG